MTNKQLKLKINRAFEEVTPDIRPQLVEELNRLNSCEVNVQPPKQTKPFFIRHIRAMSLSMAVMCCLIIGLFTIFYNSKVDYLPLSNGYVSIDINPSVEFVTNNKDIVRQVRGLNKEAQLLIAAERFIGMDVVAACEKLIKLAENLGYIKTTEMNNVVEITAINDNSLHEIDLINRISTTLAASFKEYSINGKILTIEETKALQKKAATLGVSCGKYVLMHKVMKKTQMTVEQAKALTPTQLNEILKDFNSEVHEAYAVTLAQRFAALENEKIRLRRQRHMIFDIENIEDELTELKNAININKANSKLERFNATYNDFLLDYVVTLDNHNEVLHNIKTARKILEEEYFSARDVFQDAVQDIKLAEKENLK